MGKSRRSRASSGPCPSLPPLQAEITELEGLLRYDFSNASLIAEALTHSSVAGHASYERLEFVGDAALGLAFAKRFFLTKPSLDPEMMTDLRAVNICTEKLARVAVRTRLYRFLRRHNIPKPDQWRSLGRWWREKGWWWREKGCGTVIARWRHLRCWQTSWSPSQRLSTSTLVLTLRSSGRCLGGFWIQSLQRNPWMIFIHIARRRGSR